MVKGGKTMTIIKPILEFGLLNAIVLVSGLLVLVAAAVAEWRMPQQ
jgi:hypothetical protein